MKGKLKIDFDLGDCFEIPLKNNKYAYGQYVYLDDRPNGLGTLIRIFDYFSSHQIPIDEIKTMLSPEKLLFPPIFVGLIPAIRTKRWRIIGNLPIGDFQFPKFRSTFGTFPGTYHDWRIWDGKETNFVGDLPLEYRKLELRYVWSAETLEERIETGYYTGDEMF